MFLKATEIGVSRRGTIRQVIENIFIDLESFVRNLCPLCVLIQDDLWNFQIESFETVLEWIISW